MTPGHGDEAPGPYLWLVSRGRPETLIRALEMKPMAGWPPGCLEMIDALRVRLIVVRDLPETPETLFLRLLGYPKALGRAMKEVDDLPRGSRARQAAMRPLVAWRHKIAETLSKSSREKNMQLAEMEAVYAKWEQEVRQQGIELGVEKGLEKGVEKGERAIVRKLLVLKFGALPAAIERRLDRASVADLEHWTENVLGATTLKDVFKWQATAATSRCASSGARGGPGNHRGAWPGVMSSIPAARMRSWSSLKRR